MRALDVGAGVGRVTADVLLHLVSDVVLLEPVEPFVNEALNRARASASNRTNGAKVSWPGLADQSKSVTILQGTLQDFHPRMPHRARFLDRVGYQPPRPQDGVGAGFDVIWCQWCLGHLSDSDLILFLQRSLESLNDHARSLIVVKENVCSDGPQGEPVEMFDEEDSSLTRFESVVINCKYSLHRCWYFRSDAAWKLVFKRAGLDLIKDQVQEGLPEGLFVVKMYVKVFFRVKSMYLTMR